MVNTNYIEISIVIIFHKQRTPTHPQCCIDLVVQDSFLIIHLAFTFGLILPKFDRSEFSLVRCIANHSDLGEKL